MEIDFVNLLKQIHFELEDYIKNTQLNFIYTYPEKVVIILDQQMTYRIIENLYTNIVKYALVNSNVYVELKEEEKEVILTLKNTSATPLDFDEKEITERFVRGDVSRNSIGSRLGLSIYCGYVYFYTRGVNLKYY